MTWLLILLAVVVGLPLLAMAFLHFAFGRPLPEVKRWLEDSEAATVSREGRFLVFRPRGEVRAGFFFYPGGNVHPEAYAPLLHPLAADGVMVLVLYAPMRTPVMVPTAADEAIEKYTEVPRWFVGGHSQGGAAAGFYVRDGKHADRLQGLMLVGSSISERRSIASSSLPSLCVYGEFDGFDGKGTAYEPNLVHMPSGAKIVRVPGANHKQWGAYGLHFPGGEATISRESQHAMAQRELLQFMFGPRVVESERPDAAVVADAFEVNEAPRVGR